MKFQILASLLGCALVGATLLLLDQNTQNMPETHDSLTESHAAALRRDLLVSRDEPELQSYLHNGCAALADPDSFCQRYINPASYCKSYKTDECGRSVCHQEGGNLLPCGTSGDGADATLPPMSPPPPPPPQPSPPALPPSTGEPEQPKPSNYRYYLRHGCAGTNWCATRNSYCKDWQLDECGRAVCHGSSHSLLDPCSDLDSSPPPPLLPPPLPDPPPSPPTNNNPLPQPLFAYIEDPINTQLFNANYNKTAVRSLSYFVIGITPNSYVSAKQTFAMLLSLKLSGWSGKVLLQPDLTTDAVCNVGGSGCSNSDYDCAVATCFETLRSVLGELFATSIDGVLLENENAASPALKACTTGGDRAACLDAFRNQPGAGNWEVWTLPDFTAYGREDYAEMERFAQFYNMYSRGAGGTWPCVKCGPSPGCELDFEAWRAQPGRGCPALAPQFGGAVCFQGAEFSVPCADACEGEPCLTKVDAISSFGGGIYDPALTDITPTAIGRYLGGIYTSGGVNRLPTAADATAVVTLPFTTASQPSLVAKLRYAADVEGLAEGMLGAFEAAAERGQGEGQPLRIAAWGAPCWLINENARSLVAPCAGV
ncbi:hypothetical protein TrST_g10958 [Triparma strigata]|uniref:Uncharacterized protein n=1 Tax=Triparma strigata TaxID=1606541 RepID=A0A9W7BPS6_9STRA|nr:hypothetical protein TrST_g10958 [Triparma strigata]